VVARKVYDGPGNLRRTGTHKLVFPPDPNVNGEIQAAEMAFATVTAAAVGFSSVVSFQTVAGNGRKSLPRHFRPEDNVVFEMHKETCPGKQEADPVPTPVEVVLIAPTVLGVGKTRFTFTP
jgi:hypothetical protein